ncbi:capsule assembly Wzi family protein [Sporohalobacter salinus]|uniref:capsule assembly Wzi family protein n=1 Tax=Sporohalobacter salinus TaxID=1494606 RepID=UPI00195F4410|nr:capsule assembly Wzi family protein [Sporohalobacter salinus]MBM7622991.1 hypothetical protein [Sporohalobacter salinus]
MFKKIMSILIFIFMLTSLFLPYTCKAKNSNLRNIPLHKKRIYDQISFLEVRGCIDPILTGTKPITYGDLREVIQEVDLKKVTGIEKEVVKLLLAELDGGTPLIQLGDKAVNLEGDFIVRYPSDLVLVNRTKRLDEISDEPHFILNSKMWFQPYPFLFGETGVRFHRSSSQGEEYITPAYAKLDLGPVNFEVGEDTIQWGPGYFGSLSLSGNSRLPIALGSNEWFLDNPEMDIFRIRGKVNNFKVTYFTARDSEEWEHFSSSRPDEPFISGLRTDIRLTKYLTVGAGDIAISYDSFETGVLIEDPLAYFTDLVESPQKEENINLMGSCDFTLTVPDLGKFYGEYIWDSTLEQDDLADYNATNSGAKTGILVGAYFPIKTDNALYEIRVEHTDIDDTVYTFPLDSNLEYRYKDRWLGHWAGPDSRSTVVEVSTHRIDEWEGAVRLTNVHSDRDFALGQDIWITTMEVAKNINEDFKVTGYLQYRNKDIEQIAGKTGFGLELQYDF